MRRWNGMSERPRVVDRLLAGLCKVCGGETCGGKDVCALHLEELPYVRWLEAELRERACRLAAPVAGNGAKRSVRSA